MALFINHGLHSLEAEQVLFFFHRPDFSVMLWDFFISNPLKKIASGQGRGGEESSKVKEGMGMEFCWRFQRGMTNSNSVFEVAAAGVERREKKTHLITPSASTFQSNCRVYWHFLHTIYKARSSALVKITKTLILKRGGLIPYSERTYDQKSKKQ